MSTGIATETLNAADGAGFESSETIERRGHLSLVASAVAVAEVYQGPITIDEANANGYDYFNELSGDYQIACGD